MLYEKFIRLIEDHADVLTNIWINEVKNNPITKGFAKMPTKELRKRVYRNFVKLGSWLLDEEKNYQNIAEHYMEIGKERAKENIKQSEVIFAIIMLRTVIWKYVLNQGVVNSTFDMYQALDFFQKLTTFFDKATYFVSLGYESVSGRMADKIKERKFVEEAVNSVTNWFIHDIEKS